MHMHCINWLACNSHKETYFKANYSKNSKIKYITTAYKKSRTIHRNGNITWHTKNHSSWNYKQKWYRWFIIAVPIKNVAIWLSQVKNVSLLMYLQWEKIFWTHETEGKISLTQTSNYSWTFSPECTLYNYPIVASSSARY